MPMSSIRPAISRSSCTLCSSAGRTTWGACWKRSPAASGVAALWWRPAVVAGGAIAVTYAAAVLAAGAAAAGRHGLRVAGALALVFPVLHVAYGVGFLLGLRDHVL